MKLSKFSVSQSVLVNMLALVFLVWGAYCYKNMTQEVMPQIPLKIASVTTIYPGASPDEVEETVTIPIEEELEGIQDIDFVHSISTQGRSLVLIQFRDYVEDMSEKVRRIDQHVNRAIPDLPDQAEEPLVTEHDYVIPAINIAIGGDANRETIKEEAETIKKSVERLKGVASVTMTGVSDREIKISVDPIRMEAYNLDLESISRAISSANSNLPAGSVQADRGEVLVLTEGEFSSLEDIRNTVVHTGEEGSTIRVRDVARKVTYGFENRDYISRINGRRSAGLLVNKSTNGDTIRITDQVQDIIEKRRKRSQKGLEISTYNDTSKYIRRRLSTMNRSLLWGLGLVMVVLLLFLEWRIAVMTALGIPVSLGFAMIIHYWMGGTANMIAIFSFIVVIGVIVDDAIIVAENCFRYLEKNLTPIQAAVVGTSEVFWPVVLAVSTNIAAFLPLLLIEGRIGDFSRIIPLIATFAFVGSLIEVFLVLPSHISDFVRRPAGEQNRPVLRRALWVYRYLLKNALRYRYTFVTIFLVLTTGTIYLAFTQMDVVFFKQSYLDYFRVEVKTDETFGLDDTEKVVKKLEEELRNGLPANAIKSTVSVIGRSAGRSGFSRSRTNLATMTVDLTEEFARNKNREEILSLARNTVTNGSDIKTIRFHGQKGGPPEGRDIHVEISGPDLQKCREIAEETVRVLTKQPGTADVHTNYERGKKQLRIQPDRPRASYYGVTTRKISRAVRGKYRGLDSGQVHWQENNLDVVVDGGGESNLQPEELRRLTVQSPMGTQVPLDYLVSLDWQQRAGARTRYNGRPTVTVYGNVNENQTTVQKVLAPAKKMLSQRTKQHPDYNVKYSGGDEDINKMVRSLSRAGAVALFIIFLLMATLFRNVLHPVIIMFTVPFAVVGIVLGMVLAGEPLSFMSLMGTVAVAGVIVNDSMILLDFANRSRVKGNGLLYALMRAGSIRFRPVILTTITTICGLLPLVLGVSGQEELLIPMALSIIWGMGFGTILTLLVIPSLYHITADVYGYLERDPLQVARRIQEELDDIQMP